ncbi:MAG: alpha/beta hydrolase [Jatrophihabitans sp.]
MAVPVRVAATADGAVGYRSVGTGPTVLLIMGFGGTLDSWTPAFVASLARTHRVITFDNAGIGKTSALASPLTITAMAAQTAALLKTLNTGPVDVLGWSMGGMIAQALTVQQPALVSHLVLAATLPGDGTATSPSAAVQQQLASSVTNPAAALSLLFPATASSASSAYVSGILSWPDYHSPSVTAATAQGAALRTWVTGAEPIGRKIKAIAAPTLIADGSQDVLVPPANFAALGAAIKGSQKVIYPGAGHAFLFQDQDQFLTRVINFLG